MLHYKIHTAHGTVLFRASDSRVEHGASDRNNSTVLLATRLAGTTEQLWFDAPTTFSAVSGGLTSVKSVEICQVNGDGVTLGANGHFLCAAPDDPVASFCAERAGPWERFQLVPIEGEDAEPLRTELIEYLQGQPLRYAGSAPPRMIGPDLDPLAAFAAPWSVLKAANLMTMRARVPTARAAVVASAKDEGCYVLEWLAHARAVGFEHAFIYTNDNDDASVPLLETLHRAGQITLIHNEVSATTSPQVKAYEHSLHLLPELRAYEWAGYFDLDEFLVPDRSHGFRIEPWIDAVERQ